MEGQSGKEGQGAVTGRRSLAELNGFALLSNGASRIVAPYGLTDWSGVLELLGAHGPAVAVHDVHIDRDDVNG